MKGIQFIDASRPLAAITLTGFGAIWFAVHKGLADVRLKLNKIDARVARIEGQLQTPVPRDLRGTRNAAVTA